MAIGIVKEICKTIMGLAKELGLVLDMEDEELGARFIQGMEKGFRPEDFANTEEWLNKLLQDDQGYDSKISEGLSQKEKLYMVIGTIAAYLVEKFEQLPMKEFLLLATLNPVLYTVDRMFAISDLITNGSKVFGTIVNYLSGSDKSRQIVEFATNTLMKIEKNKSKIG